MNSIQKWLELLRRPSIGRRFAMAILAFSSIVTLASTVLQLSIEYEKDVDEINSQLNQVRDGYSQSLASSLWVTSQKDLKLQLDGIIKLPDMQYLEVLSDKDEVMAIAGKTASSQIISQYYPLHYLHRGQSLYLGKLHIVATLDGVYARLKGKILVILLTQGVKTFLVSLFILYLFQTLVGRYLKKIATFSALPTNALHDTLLVLDRKETSQTKGDELEQLANAINSMRQNLKTYYLELEESEFRWKFALEGSGAGVWDWNITDNTVLYSHHWKEMIGYADNEIKNTLEEFSSRLHPDDQAAAFVALQDYLDGKTEKYSCEYRFRCKDGSYIWMLDNGMIVNRDADGKATRMIGAHHDISAQKASEEREAQLNKQLLQSTKMESIGHLTGGIAHDFNNILGAIMGYAELSQSIMSDRPEMYGNVPRYMGEILTGSERAKQLIQQMLLFSRLSPDLKDMPSDAVMLPPVMKEVVSLLRSSIPATITLNYEIHQENLKAKIQPVQLHQIMMNLGINARDAIGEYGAITFSLGMYQGSIDICSACNSRIEGSFVDIAVKDSGMGIAEENLHSVFDPFFTTKEVGKGTGMGLSVVHGIVHQAGGHIVLESKLGEGTTFHILLPATTATETILRPETRKHHTQKNLSGLNLMVVDDEKSMSSMLKDALETQGASVNIFNDPLLALAAFKQNPARFDLMITDESMPGLSGMHLSIQLLNLRPKFPIVLCTGYSDHASAEAVAKIGIAAFMFKPLDMPHLIGKITELTRLGEKH